jgi:hypothetical protein
MNNVQVIRLLLLGAAAFWTLVSSLLAVDRGVRTLAFGLLFWLLSVMVKVFFANNGVRF